MEFEVELEMETRYQVYCVYYFRLACSAPFLSRLTQGAPHEMANLRWG